MLLLLCHLFLDNLAENSIDRANSISWDRPRTAAVKFSDEKSEEIENRPPVAGDANFVRHDTPHPRELKARHQKLFNSVHSADDNAVTSQEEVVADSEIQRPRSDTVSSTHSETVSESSSVIVRSDAEIAANVVSYSLERKQVEQYATKEAEAAPHLSNGNMAEIEEQVDGMRSSDDSEGDTTAVFNERHVGFTEEIVEEEEIIVEEELEEERIERHNKLHRRDTPHHLKNKRINLTNNKTEQDRVASILAEALNKETSASLSGDNESMKTSSSFSSCPPPLSGPVEIKHIKVEVIRLGGGLGLVSLRPFQLIKLTNATNVQLNLQLFNRVELFRELGSS